jgi:hypothetical protein
MNRIRSFSTWLLTAMVTLAAGAGIVALDQSPQLLSIQTTSKTSPPSAVTTVPSHTARVVSLQTSGANSVREAAEPVVQVEDTTSTTVAPSTTTSTSTSTTTSTTSTTSTTTTTTTEDTVPATTTSLPHHHDGGGDDGGNGGSGGSGGTDN